MGEVGGVIGRWMKAWSGFGLLDKNEDDLLNLKKEKGMLLVWECSGMEASLRDVEDSRALLSLLTLFSGIGR